MGIFIAVIAIIVIILIVAGIFFSALVDVLAAIGHAFMAIFRISGKIAAFFKAAPKSAK